jgi:hypothetical protein
LQPAALTGTQSPAIEHLPEAANHQEAADCIELAETYGPPLDVAQRLVLNSWLATTSEGLWSARTAAYCVARQNGKGELLQARSLHGMIQLGEQIIHTSHELATSVNAFNRLRATLENYDDLRRLVKRVRLANGEQGIELRNGASIKYRARTGGGARGLDHIALVIYDEAQHLKPEHVAASSPTLATHPNSQVILTGSAGLATSDVWWQMRLDALRRKPGRFAYVEHSAEQVELDNNGRIISTTPPVDDPATWAQANPAYGTRISFDFLQAQHRLLGDQLFAREHLTVWDQLPEMVIQAGAKIPTEPWLNTVTSTPPTITAGQIVMAFDVEIDGSYAAITIGHGTLTDAYVETIEHRPHTGWMPARLVELVQRWQPKVIVFDSGCGPAASLLGDIRFQFEQAGLSVDILQPLTSRDYRLACNAFLQAIEAGTVRRPQVDNDRLEIAGLTARAKEVGDTWLFDRRKSPEPIVAVTTAAMARSQLSAPTFDFFLQ